MTTAPIPDTVPKVAALRPPKPPTVAERTLDNGLRVLAVRKPGVPLVELRLLVPVARPREKGDGARQRVLSEVLLSGTETRSADDIARELQRLGASLSASLDTEQLVVGGSALTADLGAFLGLAADVVTRPTFPDSEVALHRARIQQELSILGNRPQIVAETAYRRRLYGSHPYGTVMPAAESVAKVSPKALRALHAERVLPRGSTLVLVGDVRPQKALDEAEKAFGGWVDGGEAGQLAEPKVPAPGSILIVDRPGSVQTTIRIGGPAIGRLHPDHAALSVANTIFGGGFSSRLVSNIREDKGYTYSPHSGVSQLLRAAHLTVGADVATGVTGPALTEIAYELSRMATLPVSDDELASAKRYLQGSVAIATQTQAGVAGAITMLVRFGLGVDHLVAQFGRIAAVTAEDVLRVAATYFPPRRLHTVLVGDADVIRPAVETFGDVEVVATV